MPSIFFGIRMAMGRSVLPQRGRGSRDGFGISSLWGDTEQRAAGGAGFGWGGESGDVREE